ncbi:hypothetical protein DFJ63DRAFT_321414 [Scheffersomyces coipomensis]|uniref:uncharacterized protein n=1 Tax=Scheffersomyces coipomensis TaxID=1788519 RepID=UPI00315D08CF
MMIRNGLIRQVINPRSIIQPTYHYQYRSFITPPSFISSQPQSYTITKIIHNCNASLLFEIVSSIDQYPSFIPFLQRSFVSSRDEGTGLPLSAGLTVGWKQYEEEFICDITTIMNQRVIAESVNHSEGSEIFEFLKSEWNFKNVKVKGGLDKCKVDLKLDYQFKNPLYNSLSSLFNQQITDIMIKAFESRVRQLQKERQILQ